MKKQTTFHPPINFAYILDGNYIPIYKSYEHYKSLLAKAEEELAQLITGL